MALTANKGWPYPVGTDRVVDGDDAMKAIADQLDARVGAYVITPASVLNGTINADGSVTANASSGMVELRGVFSARFRTYRVVFSLGGSGTTYVSWRYMVGTTAQAPASGYTSQRFVASGATLSAVSSSDAFGYANSVNSALHSGTADLFDPFDATVQSRALFSTLGGGLPGQCGVIWTGAAASHDGFAIGKATGSTTGWIKVFGM